MGTPDWGAMCSPPFFSPPYFLEIWSLSELEAQGFLARLDDQGVLGICLSLPTSTGATGIHSQGQLLCECWEIKLKPS